MTAFRIGVRLRHQRPVLVRVGSGAALEQVRGQRHVAFIGHGVRHLPDPVYQPVPLMDQHQRRKGALPLGHRQVAACGLVPRDVVHVLSARRGRGAEDRCRQPAIIRGAHLDADFHAAAIGALAALRDRRTGEEHEEEADAEDA